jgi:hypothetical protein
MPVRIILTVNIPKFLLTFGVISCCWLVGAASRAGLYVYFFSIGHGLPILVVTVCAISTLFRLYKLDGVFTLISSAISIIALTYVDWTFRNSDLYKELVFYVWQIALISIFILLLVFLVKTKHVQNSIALTICWILFISVTFTVGINHMNHRSNAMMGVDYLVLVAAALTAAEMCRRYSLWRSRSLA